MSPRQSTHRQAYPHPSSTFRFPTVNPFGYAPAMLIRSPVICDRCRASGKAGDPGFTAAGFRPLDFTPVPGRRRHNGWTAARQRGFIKTLADTGSVRHSANAVNMTPESAYALRRRPGAAEFCAAWTAALDHGIDRLVSVTMERAIHGVPVPVFWQGKQVGERRIYNDRLAMFHLRHRLPDRYGTLESPARGTRSAQTRARARNRRPPKQKRSTRRSSSRRFTNIGAAA